MQPACAGVLVFFVAQGSKSQLQVQLAHAALVSPLPCAPTPLAVPPRQTRSEKKALNEINHAKAPTALRFHVMAEKDASRVKERIGSAAEKLFILVGGWWWCRGGKGWGGGGCVCASLVRTGNCASLPYQAWHELTTPDARPVWRHHACAPTTPTPPGFSVLLPPLPSFPQPHNTHTHS